MVDQCRGHRGDEEDTKLNTESTDLICQINAEDTNMKKSLFDDRLHRSRR